VDETADLDRCLPMLEKGGYYHAGQVCVSVQRVFVHRARLAETEGRLAERARTLRVGDPESDQTEVGPLIRAKDVDRVASWVDEAVAGGAHLAAGGKKLDHQCYAPTLLVQPPDDSRVMTEEVFGPVVCLTAFDDLDEAIRRANAVRWAFQAAIMTQDVTRALRAARRLDASTVLINDHTAFRADWMPFGGRRASGLGVGGMPYSVRELCAPKLIVLRG
jgi:acyl-CoA reductase-like NAD-dependent aldehyde dehydrogenase